MNRVCDRCYMTLPKNVSRPKTLDVSSATLRDFRSSMAGMISPVSASRNKTMNISRSDSTL